MQKNESIINRMIDKLPSHEADKKHDYWISPAIPAWSGRLELPPTPYQAFVDQVIAAADTTKHRYTGLVELDNDGNVTRYTGTTYPRKKYAMPSIAERQAGIEYLAEQYGVSPSHDTQPDGTLRAVIGLYAGQQDHYDTPPDFNPKEVEQALPPESTVTPAQVLTIRFDDKGKISTYTEPVAVVTALVESTAVVCELGVALQQERFTLETFSDERHDVVMVETIHCKEPEYL